MSHTEPGKLDIEKYAARELDKERAASLESHFKECKTCHDYYLSIVKERETFLRVYPYSSVAEFSTKVKKQQGFFQKLLDITFRPVLVPVYAAVLIAAVILPIVMREQTGFISETTQFKGGNGLTFAYMRDGAATQGDNSYRIKDNDRVQIFYSIERACFVSLLSIDESAQVSFYHPDINGEYCSVKSSGGSNVAFPGSIMFGSVTGDELVIMILSDNPLRTADVKAWVSQSVNDTPDLSRLAQKVRSKSLDKNVTVHTLLLKKG